MLRMDRAGRWALLAGLLLGGTTGQAHEGGHPSVTDTIASAALRLQRTVPEAVLDKASPGRVAAMLTPAEREVLAGGHLRFRINVPCRVLVVEDARLKGGSFWLAGAGFRPLRAGWREGKLRFAVWARDFPAGEVGLGVNSLTNGEARHYFVLLRPLAPAPPLAVDGLYPGQLRVDRFQPGCQPWVDEDDTLDEIPPALRGLTLIRTMNDRRAEAVLTGRRRRTAFPAGPRPDHVVLTWASDPTTTQTIQWRTSPAIARGMVTFYPQGDPNHPVPHEARSVTANTARLVDPFLANDPVVLWHTAELTDLAPGTTYVYRVGDGVHPWSAPRTFTTAPAGPAPFSFVYMGDAQNGLDRWGQLIQQAARTRPTAAFYLMAGDLVNKGNERDKWDEFFHFGCPIFSRRPIVPVIGNHECQGGHPTFFMRQFAVPLNGPQGIEPGRVYAFRYSNALFVVLDSNLDPASQAGWLDETLADETATWKFVAFHHPAYSSAPNRDNKEVRRIWTPIFDRHQVDLVLQGHDHAYLRTWPLREQRRVRSPNQGTTYVVAVSGTKMYKQAPRPYTAVGFTGVSTFQVLDIQIEGHRLTYRAHDAAGRVRDEFVIEKPESPAAAAAPR